MIVFRYSLMFVFPVVLTISLHYGTYLHQIDAQQNAWDWISNYLSEDVETRTLAFERLLADEINPNFQWLSHVLNASIVLGASVSGMLVPVSSTVGRGVNLISTMVAGFCFSKFIGVIPISWPEFTLWMAIGVGCAVIVAKMRGALAH